MSLKQNDDWIASNYESFQEAVLGDDLTLARAIIADAREEGFTDAALVMERELIEKQNEHDNG